MAHILPETLPQFLPGEVLKTFRTLKALPNTFYIWHHLAPWQPNAPDFLIITQEGRTLLVKVSSSSATQATSAAQLLLIDYHRPALGAGKKVLASFQQALHLPDDTLIETLTIFPNIPHKQVLESRLERSAGEPHWARRDLHQPDSGMNWEDFFPLKPIETVWLEKIRQSFTPEVVVPVEMTVRPPPSAPVLATSVIRRDY